MPAFGGSNPPAPALKGKITFKVYLAKYRMEQNLNGRVLIFSGRANVELAEDICKYMKIELGRTVIKDFSDEEIYVRIEENVRGGDVFVIQPTCSSRKH